MSISGILAVFISVLLSFSGAFKVLSSDAEGLYAYRAGTETDGGDTHIAAPEEPAWGEEDVLTVSGYDLPWYIRINVEQNVVNIYRNAGNGRYEPYTAFVTSTGTYTLHEGVFALSDKYEWRELYGGMYGHYACRIYSGLLFHSCPCTAMDVNTVDIGAYNALGTAASLGCMRLRDVDAKWIYENCVSGTLVEFYDAGDPGPFGKPAIEPLPEGTVKDPTA